MNRFDKFIGATAIVIGLIGVITVVHGALRSITDGTPLYIVIVPTVFGLVGFIGLAFVGNLMLEDAKKRRQTTK